MTAATLPRTATGRFWALAAALGVVVLAGLGAAHFMEEAGHAITGMNNRIVWGMPHVFAIFLIVAASGVLNVASVGSVFGRTEYKSRAPLSGLLCIGLLAGGLAVLMLDLGRPERMIVAATHYNFTSVFAWNVFLYTGMFAIVAVYLWTLMERRMNGYSGAAGLAAFVWRFVLTTGTGMIFAFLVARQAYGSALLPPLFIVMSLAWGTAVFLAVQAALYAGSDRTIPPEILRRIRNLLGIFIAAVLYFTLVYHLTNAYFAKQVAFTRFILVDGGVYPLLFWGGFFVLGSVLPLVLIWHPRLGTPRSVVAASLLTIVGAFALLYVFIIGGQAWPLEIFPGYATSSTFADGTIAAYAPSLPEVLLGLGGVAIALLIAVVGLHVLPFAPQDDPEARAKASASA
ncbi:MAG: polysulfide reductase NrfD [Betaproteobacteria bacterium]|nr:polysulfide reductase NrfD [Betaproteobacteria bacterium]